jgi:hypothetical protein
MKLEFWGHPEDGGIIFRRNVCTFYQTTELAVRCDVSLPQGLEGAVTVLGANCCGVNGAPVYDCALNVAFGHN